MKFEFTSDLLPLHHFTEITGFEVKNRYECMVKKEFKPCEDFCNQLRIYDPNTTDSDIWDCYKRLGIQTKDYGR
jgi:hypothetical protein